MRTLSCPSYRGIGGARTAGPLSKIASRYIGLDYSQGMIEVCRARYTQLESDGRRSATRAATHLQVGLGFWQAETFVRGLSFD